MTSRKRKNSSLNVSNDGVYESNNSESSVSGLPSLRRSKRRDKKSRDMRRRQLLETLETRMLLAGPQLIGIQPNEGALITDGTVRDSSPRVLTFGFDEDQVISAQTFDGIQISRAGEDGQLGTGDDVPVRPGLITLGDPNQNEVVVRFAEALPDDQYRIEVFGFDDAGLGITGLRNANGELFVPSDPNERSETIDFTLSLGALVEAVVPQPVIRNDDGSLSQNRNEIVVYFNEDPLFVEDDDFGNPTPRSAENPRFYQLLLTQETVRTTDDSLFFPDEVVYDSATHTARLIFSDDINQLTGVPLDGGTWRLRVGTAVDDRVDLIIRPEQVAVTASAVTDFQQDGLRVVFATRAIGEAGSGVEVRFEDNGPGPVSVALDGDGNVVFDFGGGTPTVQQLADAIAATPAVDAAITMRFELDGAVGAGGTLAIPRSYVGSPALVMQAAGELLTSSLDVGIFGQDDDITSIVLSESIDPQAFDIELRGGNDDPGHRDLEGSAGQLQRHINPAFGADTTDGITEIPYNFNGIFESFAGTDFLNQITERHKIRIREVLNSWAAELGVQFRETQSEGITFAVGATGSLRPRFGTTLVSPNTAVGSSVSFALDAALRIDPAFTNSAIVFSNQADFDLNYGEDFTRKAAAGVGFLLGLEQAQDLPAQTTMALDFTFLNANIDALPASVDLEPVFPSVADVVHGQYVHNPDSVDIDLFRFEVDLDDVDKVGTLTVETFAERLPDSSLLDTTLTLFQEIRATASTDLGVGSSLEVTFTSQLTGRSGNNSEIRFIRSDRAFGDNEVRVNRVFDDAGQPISNVVLLDLPRRGPNILGVPAQDVVDAVNNDPFASSLFRAAVTVGSGTTDISGGIAAPLPVVLSQGGLTQLAQNDDYFSEDSRIIASLGEGVYYVGVSASGNDSYDPTIPGSGYGGRTQGAYDLHMKFEPQVDEVDVIRDLDSPRANVPGTPLDGDGDGTPGGVHNFWFQTRPVNRILNFIDNGEAIVPGQTLEVVSGGNVVRTYEFVPNGGSPIAGNVPVFYSDGSAGFPTPAGNLAAALAAAINTRQAETGVSVTRSGSGLEFTGERLIELSTDFRGANAIGRNIFVDKLAGPNADGSLSRPFNNIANSDVANAFDATIPGDIVRIVGNGGLDGDVATELDNFSYQIGITDVDGNSLSDGRSMEVPKGVTTMIDAGAVIKLRGSYINVGSTTSQVDRSGGALQVLGTPRLVELSVQGDPIQTTLLADEDSGITAYDDGSVIITSIRDLAVDFVAAGDSLDPAPGDWGGLIFRRDVDQFEGRRDLEDEGIFLQTVNHAEIRYGGSSNVLIDSVQQLVNPIQIINMRPNVTFNEITRSADSAISASPDSFEETSYQSPRFQQAGSFTADFQRVGPEISNNRLLENTVNGLFIRVPTTATQTPRELTVSGRFDDIDVVHVLPENLIIASQPGGSISDGFAPSLGLVSARELPGGVFAPGDYIYKMTFVDRDGFESQASIVDFAFTVNQDSSSIELTALPLVNFGSDFASRRLYRADAAPNPVFRLVADLDASSASFIDNGSVSDGILDTTRQGIRGRLDGSLVMDPGLVMKLSGARIELQPGSVLLAEGDGSNPIVFSSIRDDRYGAGGTFDTNNDDDAPSIQPASQGDWAGIYAGPTAAVSLDQSVVAYAGGISLIEGGETRGFVPLQLQQAEGRITNSRFEFNDSGQDGAGPAGRFGRLSVTPSTIHVRGSQPIIVGNTFVDNDGTIIDIDADSLTADRRIDTGRQTGPIDRFDDLDDNFGPLIRYNRYEDNDLPGLDQITGLEIRGGTLATESVWDDTDIVHLVFDTIIVDNFHSGGGLKLRSRPDESLVVKLGDQDFPDVFPFTNERSAGQGTPNSATIGTGLTASGTPNDATDRIGGTLSILGHPDSPVVLTSFRDDTVGAGLQPDGTQFSDNNGDKTNSRPEPNDWRSVLLEQFSNDRNVAIIPELELSTEVAPGLNGDVDNAQFLGELAARLTASDEVLRLGFEVEGFLSNPNDVDTYSFIGRPGTEVWVDIDRTSFTLDSVIELLDENGNVLARSDNSGAEIANGSQVDVFDSRLEGITTSLQARDPQYSEFGAGGVYEDYDTDNPRDAGIHFTLTGNSADPTAQSTYFFRVRSASLNPDDTDGGLTRGGYRFQVRLTEDQEFPGSVVRYADIRYANHGIHVQGLLGSSPLLGEAAENEAYGGFSAAFDAENDQIIRPFETDATTSILGGTQQVPSQRAQYLGNIVDNIRNVISVAGELSTTQDVDFYQIDVLNDDVINGLRSMIFDVDYADGFNRPDTNISVYYDPDGEFSDTSLPQLVLFGTDSNVLDDLTSPLGENDASEKLSRGSIATGDPLVGPVTLVEGTYYVGISAAGVEPAALTATQFVRREPINSVRRIAEQRFDAGEGPSTAGGPVLDELFTSAAIAASGFVAGGDSLPGHGKPVHFDGSNGAFATASSTFSEAFVAFGDAPEVVGATLRAASLDAVDWSVADNTEIGGEYQFDFNQGRFASENTSTYIPHVTIDGNLGNDRVDFYEFTVDNDNSRVILDVDYGHNFTSVLDPDFSDFAGGITDPSSIDTKLDLFVEDPLVPGTYSRVNLFGGSISSTLDGRAGSFSVLDPMEDLFLPAGTYVIGVAQEAVTINLNSGVISPDLNQNPAGGPLTYRLHVSVEGHALPTGTFGNQTILYDRALNTTPGTLTSEVFDLSGYVSADMPVVYFNYLFDPHVDLVDPTNNDSVSVRIFSADNPAGRSFTSQLTPGTSWFQLREEIGDFAGHAGVQMEITYNASAVTSTNIGLQLDDFIIGFAERGETIFNAPSGNDAFTGFSFSDIGEYQLETRPATEYALTTPFGLQLQQDYDTNDRHNQSITIVAPEPDQISVGDTFVIGDGGFNQTFEFTDSAGSVQFGNTPVLFNPLDPNLTRADIATAIRTAINQQTNIDIEASSSAGEDNEALSDGRLSLSGSARGSFESITTASDAPSTLSTDLDGNLLLPAILHDGLGDSNYLRTQGQVILDSNKISDVRAIGIWSEPGIRDVDPEDIRDNNFFNGGFNPFFGFFGFGNQLPLIDGNHPFLQMPPVGNTYPGAARNLPVLNDSVLGGLAPGVVVSNNTIDSAGYSGIKIDGETAPFVLDVYDLIEPASVEPNLFLPDIGRTIREGGLMVVDAGGTRVVFEFEEIDGVPGPIGSGTAGGNGVRDGHVPIYFREDQASGYNRPNAIDRDSYSSIELATSILQSIQGSILVTNGLVELVTATIGPSPYRRNRAYEAVQPSEMAYDTAAVYLQGVSDIYFVAPGQDAILASQAPVAESAQPFARIVNNTIYGQDGRESEFPQSNAESNDLIVDAIDTKLGPSHRSVYTSTAQIGDNNGPVSAAGDVDFYRVNLDVGDRLVVDIDTLDGGANTAVQIFNARGERQTFIDQAGDSLTVNLADAAPDYLDPESTLAGGLVTDLVNTRDAFIDFFAPQKGVYYVAVSGENNVDFEPDALSGREGDAADVGPYTIRMETYAPRTHVISADSGNATGLKSAAILALADPTFTITQVPDLPPNAIVGGQTNQVTFRFVPPNTAAPAGEVPVPITANDGDFLPDIMRAISAAIEPLYGIGTPLPNNDSALVPGPISRVRATALGGIEGDNDGLVNTSRRGLRNGILIVHRDGLGPPVDFTNSLISEDDTVGFSHDRRTTGGSGTTENYVFVENASQIELSADLASVGFRLDPDPGKDTDQLINETGVMIANGASPALLNNVFLNLHESVVVEETRFPGFGFGSGVVDNQPKPMEVVVVGSVFQYDEPDPNVLTLAPTVSVGLTTDLGIGPSNINGGTDDFNVTNLDTGVTLQNPGGDNFLPEPFSPAIDSNIDSLVERSDFASLKQSVGIPISNVLAPLRDVTGVKRADNPNFPNTGQGSAVFGDRGSTELADFVGPVAIAEAPRDNDAQGIDVDPNTSFISRDTGVLEEFRIQLRDAGDASDPFTGSGIDNNTVVVAEIPGLRPSGANVTLFEDEELLIEGIDYTFNYDETKNIITLTSLAGIWENDRAYRIQMNNQDRTVVLTPSADQLSDGDQIEITDSNGGQVVFEFESGFQLQMPDPITLQVPRVGTNQGGLIDGGIFNINDGVNPIVVFEFDSDGTTLPNTEAVQLPVGPTPNDNAALDVFLEGIAENIRAAIQRVIDDPGTQLNVDVRVVGSSVVVGAERGSRADVATSGLVASARTIGLQVPGVGAGVGGVAVGDTFEINDGTRFIRFQFTDVNTPAPAGFVGVDITPVLGPGTQPLDTNQVALAIQQAILQSNLDLDVQIIGSVVYLNLPSDGSVQVSTGQLRPVSVSRTPGDGDLIVFTPNDGSPQVVFEINRTDEPDGSGGTMDDGVNLNNTPIDMNRATTGDELAGRIANAVRIPNIAGLSPNEVRVIGDGLLTIGGESGLGLAVSGNSVQVIGSPDVTGPSTLEIFGPLLIQVPFGTPTDGDELILFDLVGNPFVLEFDDDNILNDPTASRIAFTRFDDIDTLSTSILVAINTSGAGIVANYLGAGRISLGRIADTRVDTSGSNLTTQRGVVSDGEVLTITQAGNSVSYEFDSTNSVGVSAGNIPVSFDPNSTTDDVANSLASAINNNPGGLILSAVVEDGLVKLNDLPGTFVDVTAAPTLILTGVPGGAIPVRISPAFSAEQVKQALLIAINSVNTGSAGTVTSLAAEDRGGASLFVENGLLFEGPITHFYLPGIRDVQGNPLKANRDDNTTQFTILLPTVGLDYGDAADPIAGVPGRYPTTLANDGARHVVGSDLYLGTQIDADADGLTSLAADGDDSVLDVTTSGTLFTVTFSGGLASINVQSATVDPALRDGDTVTINAGIASATLEFDINGRFDEDNFAISPDDINSVDSILAAIVAAIEESPLEPASVTTVGTSVVVSGDDEDGISFVSPENPGGVLNPNTVTPITVTVTGGGVLQGWADYDADGDWENNERILFFEPGADPTTATPRSEVIFSDIGGPQTFTLDTYFPASSPDPIFITPTTTRFRVSRSGSLGPTGLSLSGEVEDYSILLVPGSPPTLTPPQAVRNFTVDEEFTLQALDTNGVLTAPVGDDGLLAGVVDPEGDAIAIFPDDTGIRQLRTENGTLAGELSLSDDGTFTFQPTIDFNGRVSFTARVTDLNPSNPAAQLVNPTPILVNIDVLPVNDQPFATVTDVTELITIDEDEVVIFQAADLIDPFYSPGPDNEINQPLVFQSVFSTNLGDSLSSRGGTLEIQPDGRSLRYTPPADENGAPPDTFRFIVADVPGGAQIPEAADKQGTVSITILPVNDAPIVGDDSFTTQENENLTIAINGGAGFVGILDNDSPGPANESGQSLVFPTDQFPVQTPRGGRVDFQSGTLVYRPPAFYSGPDSFTYTVEDNLGAASTGQVNIVVGGDNDAPIFIGVNGDASQTSISLPESKPNEQSTQYDVSTWFLDPENDDLTFEVSSSNEAIVEVELDGTTLTLTRPAFAFGTISLMVEATDGEFTTVVNVPVTIVNENDSPLLVGTLDPLSGNEDQTVVSELANVFEDPDGDSLSYTVTRLGEIPRPTLQQISDHPLIESIVFVGDQMRITPEPDQFGTVDIEIEASDGSFRVNDFFELTIDSLPDAPRAVGDAYNVAIGSTLRVLNPANGVLRNDFDADGDPIQVDLASVTQPTLGTLQMNADGTFIYNNTSGSVGAVDSFQYRAVDTTTRESELVTVTLVLNRSQYQNPIQGLEHDVNADGFVSPIDALRIINFLAREADGQPAVPVSEIGAPPPPYYDVNGDGMVSPSDALSVINRLAQQVNNIGEGEQANRLLAVASTTAFAAASSDFLPTTNAVVAEPEPAADPEVLYAESADTLLAGGLVIETTAGDAGDVLAESQAERDESSVDQALANWEADLNDRSEP